MGLLLLSLFFLDKNCIYLDAECIYDHIKQTFLDAHSSFASAPGESQTSAEMVQVTRELEVKQQWSVVRWDVVWPYVSKSEFSCLVSRYIVLVACDSCMHKCSGAWCISFHIKAQMKLRACNVLDLSSVMSWSYQNMMCVRLASCSAAAALKAAEVT